MPLLREGSPLGVIDVLRGTGAKPFTDKQIELVETFADQAVIAIENTRLFEEVQARTRELTEALEQQTATGDILRVIAGTPDDAQPVFDAIAQSALRLFGVSHVAIMLREGDSVRCKATAGTADPRGDFLIPLERDSTSGRSILDRTVISIGDTEAADAPSFARDSGRVVGFRAMAAAPMLREGIAIGSVHMMRKTPGPFSNTQIELLKTFADQAVIAIENARLFDEVQLRTRELARSVQELQALGEVGRAVSSTLDLKVVLKTIVDRAVASLRHRCRLDILLSQGDSGPSSSARQRGSMRRSLQGSASLTFLRERLALARRLPSDSHCRFRTLPSVRAIPCATPCLKQGFAHLSSSRCWARRGRSARSSCGDASPGEFSAGRRQPDAELRRPVRHRPGERPPVRGDRPEEPRA